MDKSRAKHKYPPTESRGSGGAGEDKPAQYTCPVCAGESIHYAQAMNWGEMRRCLTCNLIFANPLHLPQEPKQFFGQAYLGHIKVLNMSDFHKRLLNRPDYSQEVYSGRFLNSAQKKALKWIKRNLPPGSTILDIGCGRGDFLYSLRNSGFNPIGLDVAAPVVTMLQEEGFMAWHGAVGDIPHQFPEPAACTCFFVLHHTPDPVGFISDIKRRFPQAWLLISEISDWRVPIRTPPRHLTLWSTQSLRTALARAAYNVRVMNTTGRFMDTVVHYLDIALCSQGILPPVLVHPRLILFYHRASLALFWPLALWSRLTHRNTAVLAIAEPR